MAGAASATRRGVGADHAKPRGTGAGSADPPNLASPSRGRLGGTDSACGAAGHWPRRQPHSRSWSCSGSSARRRPSWSRSSTTAAATRSGSSVRARMRPASWLGLLARRTSRRASPNCGCCLAMVARRSRSASSISTATIAVRSAHLPRRCSNRGPAWRSVWNLPADPPQASQPVPWSPPVLS